MYLLFDSHITGRFINTFLAFVFMRNETIRRIDDIVARINTHPEYSKRIFSEERRSLRKEADIHSLELEFNRVMSGGYEESRGSHKEAAITLEGLNRAWDFLARNGVGVFNLSKIGKLIEPCNKSEGYRTIELQFGGFAAIDPREVLTQMENMIEVLEDIKLHPVLRAINSHIDLVRIHPYEDGNGRAARLLQNFHLESNNYPPGIIPAQESIVYRSLMRKVLGDRYRSKSSVYSPSDSENLFIEYVSSKILSSAERLEKELRERRAYSVIVTNLDQPGVLHSIAKNLRGLGRDPRKKGLTVKIERERTGKKAGRLLVIGDIGTSDVERTMRSAREKYDIKYKIDLSS